MGLKLDEGAICARCKKDRVHADICKAKDRSMRESLEVEFSICGVCGKGYCSIRADPDDRICELCEEGIYQNVKPDGTLERRLIWQDKE